MILNFFTIECFQPCYKQNDIAPCGYGHLKNYMLAWKYILCWQHFLWIHGSSIFLREIDVLCARVATLYNLYSWRWFKSMSFLFQHSRWSSQSHRLLLLCRDFSFACGMHLRSIGWQIMFWESLSVFRFVCITLICNTSDYGLKPSWIWLFPPPILLHQSLNT